MNTIFSVLIPKAFAQTENVFGSITSKVPNKYGDINTSGKGLALLIGNGLRLFFVVAGMLAFLNFVIAGFQYMMAGGDAKAIQSAWDRIWYSLLGLILMVGSFALAVLFGYLIMGDPFFMLRPQVYTP